MPADFSARIYHAVGLSKVLERAKSLFDDLIGLEVPRLEASLRRELEGPSVPVRYPPTASVGELILGPGHGSLWLEASIPEVAIVSAFAPDAELGEGYAEIWVGPETRTGASYLLAACLVVAAAELSGGVVENNVDHLTPGDGTPQEVMSQLARAQSVDGTIEERARQRLRPLPGYKNYPQIQQRA